MAWAWTRVVALNRVVDVEVASSARHIFVLEGPIGPSESGPGAVEPLTFVPDCAAYAELPCSCGATRFDSQRRFWPGWDRLWHLPSLQRMLTVQALYKRSAAMVEYLGPYFWHSAGFGTFKNSLDVMFSIANSFAAFFPGDCEADAECVLSGVFEVVLNWLISLTQFSMNLVGGHVQPWAPFLEQLGSASVAESWAAAPWALLLHRPQWGMTFVSTMSDLEDLVVGDGAAAPPAGTGDEALLERALDRMAVGRDSACGAAILAWRAELQSRGFPAAGGRDAEVAELDLQLALEIAFGKECRLHPVRRLVLFARAVRPLLPNAAGPPWPAADEDAKPLDGSFIYRLAGDQVVHRRVTDAELHFLAADVVEVGGELQLDLLWLALSDDDCVPVGTNFHNKNGSYQYYSFLQTLSAAHVVHWRCNVSVGGALGAEGATWSESSTTSFSGFLSITTCRLPSAVAELVRAAGTLSPESSGPMLQVSLRSGVGDTSDTSYGGERQWQPEPLWLRPRPRPLARRLLTACTATLHGARRVHEAAPHAVEDWINYHILVGVEHFVVFDTDGSYEPYLRHFIARGEVTYHTRFPGKVAPKLAFLTAGLNYAKDQRPMVLEPHALDACVWENRQVSDWVIVIHSFEEYLHSPTMVRSAGMFNIRSLLPVWAAEIPRTAVFELFQEPMGGKPNAGAKTVLSRWTHKRGLDIDGLDGTPWMEAAHRHFQPFAWIIDPLNVLQTAVHFAQARGNKQAIVAMPREMLRINHYVDLGSNSSRCQDELGGCEVEEASMTWAEAAVLSMRVHHVKLDYGVEGCPLGAEIASGSECEGAIKSLGLQAHLGWSGSDSSVPPFCSVREKVAGGGEHMHWNTWRGDGAGPSGRADLAPVCRMVPEQ